MPNRFYSSTSVTTSLSGTVGPATTSITLASTVGMPGSLPYTLIIDPDTLVEEIVTVTGASGTTLTVTRGEDGTTGQAHTAGAVVVHGVSARDFRETQAHMDLTANVHGVSGALADAASVAALSASVSGSLGGKVDKSTLAGKGYLVTATAGATPVGLAPGADGSILTADSSQTNGVKWSAVTNAPLAIKSYGASAGTSIPLTTSGDLDATNLVVTFTAPASGAVTVALEGLLSVIASAGSETVVHWTLRSGAADVSGTDRIVADLLPASTLAGSQRFTTSVYVTGLTPGNSYTYKWGGYYIKTGTVTSVTILTGPTTGPATMIVRAA